MRTLSRFALGVIALSATGCQNGEFKMPDFSSWGSEAETTKADATGSSSANSTSSTSGSTSGGSTSTSGSGGSSSATSSGGSTESTGGATAESSGAGGWQATEPTEAQNTKESVDVSGTEKGPWYDAKTGWMVRYKMTGGTETVWEVKDVDDKRLLMSNKSYSNGTLVAATLQWTARYYKKMDTEAPQTDCKTEDLANENVTVAGKSLSCKVVKSECTMNGQKYVTKSWSSDEVPMGIVKSESDGTVSMELVEFKKT